MPTKQCTKCKEIKELGLFCKDRRRLDGAASNCISCDKIRNKVYRKLPPDIPADIRSCITCNIDKSPTEFSKSDSSKDGLKRICKNCIKAKRELFVPYEFPTDKICADCNTEKSVNEFSKRKLSKDGISSLCKICSRNRQMAYRNFSPDTPKDIRKCIDCNVDKKFTAFGKCRGSRDGLRSSCRDCIRDYFYRKNYGITLMDYKTMFENQNGLCAICSDPETVMRRGQVLPLSVDHNHETNEVRSLLCQTCNFAVGLLADNPKRMDSASAYLRFHESKK